MTGIDALFVWGSDGDCTAKTVPFHFSSPHYQAIVSLIIKLISVASFSLLKTNQ
jgi:hypothetical protein